jgi:hypothetical protein
LLAGEWKTGGAGDTVVEEEKPVSAVKIVVSGRLQVTKDGQRLMPLNWDYVFGTELVLSGQLSPVAPTFAEPACYFSWPLANLQVFLDRRPDFRQALQGLINRDLVAKLQDVSGYLARPT